MELLLLILVIAVVAVLVSGQRRRRAVERGGFGGQGRLGQDQLGPQDLDAVRRVADEDVTRFGEELRRLDDDLLTTTLDEPTRQDYQRALDSYDAAKESLARVTRPEEIRHVTQALEDGRYAVACVRARVAGEPLPARRPPCFFNPAHGPSTTDIEWAPPGGAPRQVPVCAADADRVAQGAQPDVRTVPYGVGRVPYWQGGPAYTPWASGYFGGYAASGLVPGFLLGTLLSPGIGIWGPGWGDGWGDGYGPGDAGDAGDWGGNDGDWGGGGNDGDWGGGDFGGGNDGDWGGGGDFGGGNDGGFF
jgi:hypothetical protein